MRSRDVLLQLCSNTTDPDKRPALIDLRDAEAYMASRLRGSYSLPLEHLVPRMFLLPCHGSPLGLITCGPAAAQHVRGAAARSGAKEDVPVVTFLESRGWPVAFCVEDNTQLWEAAAELGLLESGGDPLQLKRRWMFQPSLLVQQQVQQVERLLARDWLQSHGGARGLLGRETNSPHTRTSNAAEPANVPHGSGGAAGSSGEETEAGAEGLSGAEADGTAHRGVEAHCGSAEACGVGVPVATLRVLDVGCGSGRDLVWLATRRTRMGVAELMEGKELVGGSSGEDGVDRQRAEAGAAAPAAETAPGEGHAGPGHTDEEGELEVCWEGVGVDSWHGALQRTADVLTLGEVPPGPGPGSVRLLLAEIDGGSGALRPLPPPAKARATKKRQHSGDGAAAACEPPTLLRYLLPGHPAPSDGGQAADGVSGDAEGQTKERADGGVAVELDLGTFDLVVCVRFLCRAFLPRMAELLRPGGVLLYSTFVDGPGLQAFGRPQGREHVLEATELGRSYFGPGQGFEVLRDEVGVTSDGRELSMFCARKLWAGAGC